jgi:hypothetical protein
VHRNKQNKHSVRVAGLISLLTWPGLALAADPRPDAASDSSTPPAPSSSDAGHEQTAKQLQNPLSSLIILPFQDITTRGFEPGSGVQNTLNIQPVIPVALTSHWKLLLRPIVPVINNSWPERESGLGDVQFEPFLAPARHGSLEWGVGPVLSFPTANDGLGFGKYTAGPAFALFGQHGPWTYSLIVTQQWSYAGDSDRDDVSMFNLQPSVNYNLKKGWYVICGPLISANWKAESGQQWIVPLGGGIGKVLSLGTGS